jgi:hypothetical protein
MTTRITITLNNAQRISLDALAESEGRDLHAEAVILLQRGLVEMGYLSSGGAVSIRPKYVNPNEKAQAIVQGTQVSLGQLQMTYHDSQPEFWALRLAWEAARLAWYVVAGDLMSAREKFALVADALADVERAIAPRPTTPQ